MLKIVQDQAYRGDDWWDWSVWLEGEPTELAAIKEVVWRLHPSFSPSIVTRRNRDDGFRLSTSGWGTFRVKAEVRLKGGVTQRLTHELELLYPDDEDGTSPTKTMQRPDVGGYVHALVLPPAPGPDQSDVEKSEPFDENSPLVVVARQIVEFTEAVPAAVRRTICHGLLLAQLAADKIVPDGEEASEWFQAYTVVLSRIGFAQNNQQIQTQELSGANAPLLEAAIPVLRDAVGPTAAARSQLQAMLGQLAHSDDALPSIALLGRKIRSGGGGFGLTNVDRGEDGVSRMTSLFVSVEGSREVTSILFFRTTKVDVKVRTVVINATIDANSLAAIDTVLAAKVAPFVRDNISGLHLREPQTKPATPLNTPSQETSAQIPTTSPSRQPLTQ